jgi:hypothetical protein
MNKNQNWVDHVSWVIFETKRPGSTAIFIFYILGCYNFLKIIVIFFEQAFWAIFNSFFFH